MPWAFISMVCRFEQHQGSSGDVDHLKDLLQQRDEALADISSQLESANHKIRLLELVFRLLTVVFSLLNSWYLENIMHQQQADSEKDGIQSSIHICIIIIFD